MNVSKTIRISDDTYLFIKQKAVEGDTIDSIIKRLLNIPVPTDLLKPITTAVHDSNKHNKYYDSTNSGYIR